MFCKLTNIPYIYISNSAKQFKTLGIMKRYLITACIDGEIMVKIVYQLDIVMAIVRFCSENNADNNQIITANQC